MTRDRRLVLASRSRYRAELAAELCATMGVTLQTQHADVDERALEAAVGPGDPSVLARLLARAKAESVWSLLVANPAEQPESAPPDDTIVVGGDQLLVVDTGNGPRILHQPRTMDRAVDQLCSLSGTTHHLVNGLAAIRVTDRAEADNADVYRITMREYSRLEAVDYVERYRPLDCVGAYRIEDDAGLIASVEGEDRSGVIGFPFPAVARLLDQLGWRDGPAAAVLLSQSW